MTPEQAAWIREYVWTGRMQVDYQHMSPGPRGRKMDCHCQYPCPFCTSGRHDQCVIRDPHAPSNNYQLARRREGIVRFPGGTWASVWLADRACRLLCQCPKCAREWGTALPLPPGTQLDLFGAAS